MGRERRWPWVAQQEWRDVLFLHWPVSIDKIKPLIPAPFKLDTFDGKAWISIILFQAKNSRLRGMPSLFSYPNFSQVNVRTYVTFDDEPGIYFLSIDANSSLAVMLAKNMLGLPYQQATIKFKKDTNEISFASKRLGMNELSTCIYAYYKPSTFYFPNHYGTLDFWLTERYCLWLMKGRRIIKGPLSHKPWKLTTAILDISKSELPLLSQLSCDIANPLVHYAPSMRAYLHPFEQKGIYVKENMID